MFILLGNAFSLKMVATISYSSQASRSYSLASSNDWTEVESDVTGTLAHEVSITVSVKSSPWNMLCCVS